MSTPIVTLATFVHKDLVQRNMGLGLDYIPSYPHFLFFSFRTRRLTWDGPASETVKSEAPCHSRYGTIKILPCSNAINTEQRVRPKLNISSLVMVMSLVFQYSPQTLKSISRKNSYYLSIYGHVFRYIPMLPK